MPLDGKLYACIAKLKNYENTGLDPEEIAELAEAKAEGRLVVLPCAIGDKAYYYICDDALGEPHVGEFTVRGIQILPDGYYLSDGDCWDKVGSQFAYLTRKEAEAALKKAEEGS